MKADRDVFLRLIRLVDGSEEVFVGQAPGDRISFDPAIDGGKRMHWLCCRRAKSESLGAETRRLVLQAYDYRCAATGWRIFMPDGSSLIEAAHIVPFAESHNDDPRNGMALTPTYHKAMDQKLIAPGPDMRWHVSPIFDRRIPDYRDFVELDGRDIIYYGDERYRPRGTYLEQRVSMLRSE